MTHIWNQDELEATKLAFGRYAIRPLGQLGTMGWSPRAWTAVFITASNAEKAILKALHVFNGKR